MKYQVIYFSGNGQNSYRDFEADSDDAAIEIINRYPVPDGQTMEMTLSDGSVYALHGDDPESDGIYLHDERTP